MDPYLREMLDGSQPQPSQEQLSKKWDSDVGPVTKSSDAATGCFDCNICLDFANDPVVTLCGHLYCWPCIYKWLTHDPTTTPQCPVCKGPLSQTALVPLYGRGGESAGKSKTSSKTALDIPHRPPAYRSNAAQINSNSSSQTPSPTRQSQHHHHHHHHHSPPPPPQFYQYQQHSSASPLQFRGTSRVVDGGMAYALLPWVMNLFFGCPESGFYVMDPPYYLTGNEESLRTRRRELQAGRSLNRISVFLLCCLVLCLFLF